MWDKQRVVVTGAAGFIGSNLLKMLRREGYDVIAVDNLSAGTEENLPSGTDLRKIDIVTEDLDRHFEGAHTVFHLAAKTSLPDCSDHPSEAVRVNVLGTTRVLEACVRAKVEHLIFADTSAVYEGVEVFPTPIDKLRPYSVYACSKRAGALLCESFSNLHGLTVSTVRYFNVYGPAQDWRRVMPPVMSAFTIRLLSKEQPFVYGTGKKRRDFIHVDDVNSFHLKLVREEKIRGRVYNLGSGKDYSVLQIFDMIEGEIRSGIKPIFKPDLPAEAPRTLADISETVATGWRPNVEIQDGLKNFIEYMRQRLYQ